MGFSPPRLQHPRTIPRWLHGEYYLGRGHSMPGVATRHSGASPCDRFMELDLDAEPGFRWAGPLSEGLDIYGGFGSN